MKRKKTGVNVIPPNSSLKPKYRTPPPQGSVESAQNPFGKLTPPGVKPIKSKKIKVDNKN